MQLGIRAFQSRRLQVPYTYSEIETIFETRDTREPAGARAYDHDFTIKK